MAALLRDAECGACRKRHHFTTTQGVVSAAKDYDYVCPETGGKARMRPSCDGEAVHYAPYGAVVLAPRGD